MDTRTMRRLKVVAGLAWLVVAASGLRSALVDDGDDWELAYTLYTLALVAAAAVTVAVAAGVTQETSRPRLRAAGLVLGGLGVVSTVMAWALPLWMTLLGAGLLTVALATPPDARRAVALLGAGQLLGLATAAAGYAAHIGRRDEWGDYPVAGAVGTVVAATLMICALVALARSLDPATPGRGQVAFPG